MTKYICLANSFKELGVEIDRELSVKDHINIYAKHLTFNEKKIPRLV